MLHTQPGDEQVVTGESSAGFGAPSCNSHPTLCCTTCRAVWLARCQYSVQCCRKLHWLPKTSLDHFCVW